MSPRVLHGGEPIYDMRVEAEAIQAERRDHGVPTVQLTHPRKGVWSGKNQLGVELPFQLDANRMQTIFKMDEWGFPEVWTVSLSVTVPELVQGQFFDVEAEVNFGAGGIVQTFELDLVDGTIFSIPMNAINVRARWSDLATIQGVLPPDNVRISALVSRGGQRHARATKTSFFGAIAAGDTFKNNFPLIAMPPGPPIYIPIPAFAKSATVTPSTAANAALIYAATCELWFMANDNTAVPSIIQTIPGNFLGPTVRVPIPANARFWTIKNGAGAPMTAGPAANAGSVIWNLFDI